MEPKIHWTKVIWTGKIGDKFILEDWFKGLKPTTKKVLPYSYENNLIIAMDIFVNVIALKCLFREYEYYILREKLMDKKKKKI